MKNLLLSLFIIPFITVAQRPVIYYIPADTTILKTIDRTGNEFAIENSTMNVTGGVLTNIGNGRTEWRLPMALSGDYVTQQSSGTQAQNQIPIYTGTAKELARGSIKLIFNPLTGEFNIGADPAEGAIGNEPEFITMIYEDSEGTIHSVLIDKLTNSIQIRSVIDANQYSTVYVNKNSVSLGSKDNSNYCSIGFTPAEVKLLGITENNSIDRVLTVDVNSGNEIAYRKVSTLKGYASYSVILNQTGTGNPQADIIKNELSGSVVLVRTGVGAYTGSLPGGFPENKTMFFPASITQADGSTVLVERVDANTITITTSADGVLNDFPFEIKIYP